jgi:hypothetical protein
VFDNAEIEEDEGRKMRKDQESVLFFTILSASLF